MNQKSLIYLTNHKVNKKYNFFCDFFKFEIVTEISNLDWPENSEENNFRSEEGDTSEYVEVVLKSEDDINDGKYYKQLTYKILYKNYFFFKRPIILTLHFSIQVVVVPHYIC